jgi:demethylmenaquinone methyltransferase/2-methoxy-6-polyprenyl-1,4-benzoquinol methylase
MQLFCGLARSYDKVLDYATLFQDRYWKSWLVEEAGLRRGSRILDIGCGTCVLESWLLSGEHRIVGLDLSFPMLRIAQEKRVANSDSLMVGDAQHLPYSDSTFDAILSCYVVKYCEVGKLVSEIHRVLRPGGMLAMYDFSAPRGKFGPLHAFYVYGALPTAGRLIRLVDKDLAFTFEYLPEVIRTRRWDEEVVGEMQSQGFTDVVRTPLSGGVVTVVTGSRGQ